MEIFNVTITTLVKYFKIMYSSSANRFLLYVPYNDQVLQLKRKMILSKHMVSGSNIII